MNQYFLSIGLLLSSKIAMQHNDIKKDRVVNSMVLIITNKTELTKMIKLMRNKKSLRHDGISNKILKYCSPVIDTVIANIFKRYL